MCIIIVLMEVIFKHLTVFINAMLLSLPLSTHNMYILVLLLFLYHSFHCFFIFFVFVCLLYVHICMPLVGLI